MVRGGGQQMGCAPVAGPGAAHGLTVDGHRQPPAGTLATPDASCGPGRHHRLQRAGIAPVAIRRIVASLGGRTAPVNGSGAAPSNNSRSRSAPAAHCAAPASDANPAQANEATNTPSTNSTGCRCGPLRRGSGTARNAATRSPATCAEGFTRGRAVDEDGLTDAAPADDDWL